MADKTEVSQSQSPKLLSHFFLLIAKSFKETDVFIQNAARTAANIALKHRCCTAQHKLSRREMSETSLLHCEAERLVPTTSIRE